MDKYFNTEGLCIPSQHYMINLDSRLQEIKVLIEHQKYFTINRGRQYGKITILQQLASFLQDEYSVVSLDFQGFSHKDFEVEESFTAIFAKTLLRRRIVDSDVVREKLEQLVEAHNSSLSKLFQYLAEWCEVSAKPIVLLIDEVDNASNNQVFLDFLAQLRLAYLERDMIPTFQSVILAGVYDIKSLKMKLQHGQSMKTNSPWNIAAKFNVDMSFSQQDIASMLYEYDRDKAMYSASLIEKNNGSG